MKGIMENTFWTAFGASVLAALVTSIGIYVIRRFERWGRDHTIYFVCFAAGVLISVSFLHIVPKAFSMNPVLAFFAAALTTPVGMLVSYPFISRIDKSVLGALLAFSAGALIYVGATHLLPQAEAEHKRYSLLALGAGILVAMVIIFSKG